MAQLIDDLLKLSRISRSQMLFGEVNLSEIAKTVADGLKKTGPTRKVDFIIEPGLMANGDHNLLRVALENLMGNDWKFTGKVSEARIEIGTTQNQDKTAYYIRDNGAGFDMKYADKLFQPFQRLHGTQEFAGTGIGLATVQRIIHRHGGQIWARGKSGRRCYFLLYTKLMESPSPPGDNNLYTLKN